MKNYYTLLLLLLFSANSYCQELYLIVFKGKVTYETAQKKGEIMHYKRYPITPAMNLQFHDTPIFIIYSSNSKYVDNFISYAKKISYKNITDNLKNISNARFFQLMGRIHEYNESVAESEGSVRAVSKGLNKKARLAELDEYALPADSTKITTGEVTLEWKLEGKLSGGTLVVVNRKTGEKILDKPIDETGSETLKLNAEGWYDWEITSTDENKTIENNSFVRLSPEESKKELLKLEEFKKGITEFTKETQEFLIESYLEQNLLEI